MAKLRSVHEFRNLPKNVPSDFPQQDNSCAPMRVYELHLQCEPERGPATLAFQWEALAGPVVAIAVLLTHRLGRTRQIVAAPAAGIAGARGTGKITVNLAALPAGPVEIEVAPLDANAREGISANVAFEVPSCGLPRQLRLRMTPLEPRIQRPRGAMDLVYACFRIRCEGSEKAASLCASVRGPDGKEDSLVVPPPSGDHAVTLFALSSSHQLGSYTVTAHMVDRSGTVGTAAEAVVELLADGGRSGPVIDSIEPGDDRRVLIRGSSLNTQGLQVKFGLLTAAVIEVAASQLVVESPDLDEPAQVMVRTDQGVAWSPRPYTPPVKIRLVPAEFELAQGSAVQFTAVVTGTPDKRVHWALRGARSGAKLSRSGKLSAGLTGRSGSIMVMARSAADPSAAGQSVGRLVPSSGAKGRSVLGSLGGTIRAADGGAFLKVPGQALSRPARLSLRTESPHVRLKDDCIIVAQVNVGGDKCEFKTPAVLEVPLHIPLQPGYEPSAQAALGGGRWQALDVKTALGFGGRTLILPIRKVPVRLRLIIPWDRRHGMPLLQGHPAIQSVAPNELHEGSTAAMLVSGSNFVPGATTVDLIDGAGRIESRISIRSVAVTADGTKVGLALKVGVMTDVGEGQSHHLRLRVTTPAGSAVYPVTIIGHDELDVQSGTGTVNRSQVFSRMLVRSGARLNVSNVVPAVEIECHEVAEVMSTIESGGGLWVTTGNGARGAPGDAGGLPGLGGAGAGSLAIGGGGSGGAGATGSGGVGGDGTRGNSSVHLSLVGTGGKGGSAGGGGILPHAGGDGNNGTRGRRSNFPPGIIDLDFEPSPGGGGGGGGGGEGWIFQSTGAGGGGGGAGGGALHLSAGEAIRITGDVLANGGDGSFGQYPVTVVAPAAPYLIQAGCGGGGGGGAGGYLVLQGVTVASGTVFAAGGIDGAVPRYGTVPVDARTFRQALLQRPETGSIRIDGQMSLTRGNAFRGPDLEYVYNLLTTLPQVEVMAPGADAIHVTNERGNIARVDVPTNPASPNRAVLTLSEGFNLVKAHWTGSGMWSAPIMSCAQIRERRFLYLPNTIPVYEFTCTVSPSQAVVATERSVQLAATVVARPATAVTWSLLGGPGRIIVTPHISGALYVAPTSAPTNPVEVRAISTLDPSRFGSALMTVLPGIELAGIAATGSPSTPGIASANVGGVVTVRIPPAVYALTGQGFAPGQPVEFELIERSPITGLCETRRVPYQSTVDPGMTTLTIPVPPCACPNQLIRVPGHGSARLLVIPEISSITPDQNNFPAMSINGSGFTCGTTDVIFNTGPLPAAQILSLTCGQIQVAVRPAPGTEIRVRTPGGTSQGFTMP